MRHAKAEPFASTDHARTLTDRGHADAAEAGRRLRASGAVPDFAVVSSAVRTRETWDDVAAAFESDVEVSYDDAAYHGGVDPVLELLRASPDDADTVMFLGHNPTAAYVAHFLDDGHGDETAVNGLLRGFPTSALVVFDVEVKWPELAAETGRVTAFHAPAS